MSILIRNCEWVVTQNKARGVLKDASVLVMGGLIQELGVGLETGVDDVIDARRKALMPGLINTQTHLAMSLLRGYSDDVHVST